MFALFYSVTGAAGADGGVVTYFVVVEVVLVVVVVVVIVVVVIVVVVVVVVVLDVGLSLSVVVVSDQIRLFSIIVPYKDSYCGL